MKLELNKDIIAGMAIEREEENLAFRDYLKHSNGDEIDQEVYKLNEKVTLAVDCKECAACCRGLMINVEPEEVCRVADKLDISVKTFNDRYLERGETQNILNTIPCHFLSENKCTIYDVRFTECREFPHLHKPNFKGRVFGTLQHYAKCPIIFNVVEQLKVITGFLKVYNNGIVYNIEQV